MLVNNDFQTWHLIGWQHSCQPIRSHVRKSSITKMTKMEFVMDFYLVIPSPGPVFCLLLGVSSDYAPPITGQVTEVTCLVIGRAQPELSPSKRQKTGPGSLAPEHQQPHLLIPPQISEILIQSSAVITRFGITRYCIHHYRDRTRISSRGWIYKRHPIPRPNGRAMECLL